MNGTTKFLGLLLAVSTLAGACGGEDADPCKEASEVFAAAQANFCTDQAEDCSYCDCLNQGLVLDPESGDCLSAPAMNPVNCEGLLEQSAQACLADETACAQDSTDLAKLTCQAEHLEDACTEDGDCLFDMTCNTNTGYCSIP